jgi:hypothetical protein
MINGSVMDVGIWDDDYKDSEKIEELLLKAIKCYEHHKENNTLIENYYHIHEFPPIKENNGKKKRFFKWK